MPYDSFYFGPDNKTVYGKQGISETAFKTEDAALAAGVQKNSSYDPSTPNSPDNPYFSNVGFQSAPGLPSVTVPKTVPQDVVSSVTQTNPQTSLVDLFNQYRTQSGLPQLQSQQQELLKSIQDKNAALDEGMIKEGGRTIATPLIGARQEVLQKQVAQTLQPLVDSYRLNSETIKNIQSSLQMEMGLVQADREFELNKAQAQSREELDLLRTLADIPEGKTITIGGKQFTGLKKVNDEIQLLEKNDGSVIMVNKRTGTVSVVSGAVVGNKNLPTSAQEYEYAKSQGYKGTYTQYQNEDANRKRPTSVTNNYLNALREANYNALTKTTPGQIVNNATGNAIKLTDTQSQFFSMGSRLSTTATELQKTIKEIGTSAIKGWVTEKGFLVPVVQDNLDPKQQALMQKMYELNNMFVYFSTGKQINETEFDRLAKQTPNFKATPEFNQSALANFTSMINQRMNDYLKINGWKFKEADTTNNKDPLGIR